VNRNRPTREAAIAALDAHYLAGERTGLIFGVVRLEKILAWANGEKTTFADLRNWIAAEIEAAKREIEELS
jgi:hypothetical protein